MALIPYDRTWVSPARNLVPFYRSYEDAILQPGPLAGWTPKRTVTFSTKVGLDAARTGLQDGDYVVYNGAGVLTISSSSSNGYNFGTSSVATKAVFDFGSYYNANHVKFQSTSTSTFYGGYFVNPNNVWYVGGEYIGGGGGDILWQGGTGSGFWGAVLHGGGTHGLFAAFTASILTMSNCRFLWESFDNNHNPSIDSHGNGGGGYHDGLISDSGEASTMSNNVFMCYGHDTQEGSCVQLGDTTSSPQMNNNVFFVKAANNTFAATTASWDIATGFNTWGAAPQSGNVVELLQVTNYAGRATFCNSLTTSSTNCVTIKHGRAVNTNQNTTWLTSHDGTLDVTSAWDTRQPTKVIHQDCVQHS